MDVICPISGLRMYRAPYMLGFSFAEVHPIFRATRKMVLGKQFDILQRFTRAVSTEEKRLYFLGLLKATELIDFQAIASPSIIVIERNFFRIHRFISWLDHALWLGVKDEVIFPRYVVREDNQDLENIDVWIESLDEVMQSFVEKDKIIERKRAMMQEHERLIAEISRAHSKDMFYTDFLAKRVLEMTGLDQHPKADLYLQVLKIKAKESYGVDIDLLLELHELLENNLDFNHPLYPHILGQMNGLIAAHKVHTPNFEIKYDIESYIDESGETQTKQVDVSERAKQSLVAQTGSTDKPNKKDFANIVEFYKADARWHLANGLKPNGEPRDAK